MNATSSNDGSAPEFSVIVTSYYEERSIDEFTGRLLETLRSTGRTFELVMVNDGSTDGTFDRYRDIFAANQEVAHAIDLFRNSGQICAMSCGVAHGCGRHFIFMDSDLQLDPEELPMLIDAFDRGYDIVGGRRKDRTDTLLRRLPSWIANQVMAKVARHPLTDFGCTFKVYDGRLVRAFGFGPHKPWKTAYVFRHAGKVAEIDVTHHARRYGKSGWTFRKLAHFLFDHVVGLSSRPFLLMSFVSLAFGALLALRVLLAQVYPGSILSSVSGGLLLNAILFGIFVNFAGFAAVGEFVFRVYARTERDPIYIIKTHLSRSPPATPAAEAAS